MLDIIFPAPNGVPEIYWSMYRIWFLVCEFAIFFIILTIYMLWTYRMHFISKISDMYDLATPIRWTLVFLALGNFAVAFVAALLSIYKYMLQWHVIFYLCLTGLIAFVFFSTIFYLIAWYRFKPIFSPIRKPRYEQEGYK